jgi:hypothetical protein
MARTTFSGPVVSDNGFLSEVTNTSTGSSTYEVSVTDVTMTGAGGVGGRTRFQLNADAALGSFSNALKAQVEYGTSGKTTGLGSAFVAEMTMSAGTDAGTYAPLEIELNVPDSASLGTATSFMYASVNGADASTFDTSGVAMNVQGLTPGSAGETDAFNVPGGSFDVETDISHGLKVRIGAAEYYLPLIPVADFANNT